VWIHPPNRYSFLLQWLLSVFRRKYSKRERKRKRDERDEWRKGGTEREREVFPSSAYKRRGTGHRGWRTLDRTLWSAIIGGVGPRVSGKANFLAAREFSHRLARIYRCRGAPLDALANCCVDIGYRFVQFTRHFRRYVAESRTRLARSEKPIVLKKLAELHVSRIVTPVWRRTMGRARIGY